MLLFDLKNSFCSEDIKIILFLNNFPDFFGRVKKQFGKKLKVNFQVYDVINWETNNCNTHITQYLKKLRQSDNEV